MLKLEMFDTTLRDGAQTEGISFSVSDKLAVVKTMDEFCVRYIEAGNPGSNPKDMEFFAAASELNLHHAKLVAVGSTKRKNIPVEDDGKVRPFSGRTHPASRSSANRGTSMSPRFYPPRSRRTCAAFLRRYGFSRRRAKRSSSTRSIFSMATAATGITPSTCWAPRWKAALMSSSCATRTAGRCPCRYTRSWTVCGRFPGMRIAYTVTTTWAARSPIQCVRQAGLSTAGTFTGWVNAAATRPGILIPNPQLNGGYSASAAILKAQRDGITIAESRTSRAAQQPDSGKARSPTRAAGISTDPKFRTPSSIRPYYVATDVASCSRGFGQESRTLIIRDVAPNSRRTAEIAKSR